MNAVKSLFKTPGLEKQYLEVYESVLGLWNVAHEDLDVRTSFGITHINAAGPRDKPPLLLLPGFGANSTMWFPNVATLSNQFRVLAIDTIGQPGRSIPDPNQPLLASNSFEWISEVLDHLGLVKAHLAGVSLGGWLALNFAIHCPQRTDRVVMLDPAASFSGMSAAFMWHSLIPFMICPTRAGLINYFRWMTKGYRVEEKWGELMILGILNTHPQPPVRATAFSESDLRSVRAPVMVLIGECSVIYDPRRTHQRAASLIPHAQTEIIPEASHALIAEKPEIVNERMLKFLAEG